jgi:hypothetical protein
MIVSPLGEVAAAVKEAEGLMVGLVQVMAMVMTDQRGPQE